MEVFSLAIGPIIACSGGYQLWHNETQGVFPECSLKLTNAKTRTKPVASCRLLVYLT